MNEISAVVSRIKNEMQMDEVFYQGKSEYVFYNEETELYETIVKQENWLVTAPDHLKYVGVIRNDGIFESACTNSDDEWECLGCDVCVILYGEENYEI